MRIQEEILHLAMERNTVPKPMRVPVTHVMSEMSSTTDRMPLTECPYLIWNGSIIVTYFLSLIGFAKKIPPT